MEENKRYSTDEYIANRILSLEAENNDLKYKIEELKRKNTIDFMFHTDDIAINSEYLVSLENNKIEVKDIKRDSLSRFNKTIIVSNYDAATSFSVVVNGKQLVQESNEYKMIYDLYYEDGLFDIYRANELKEKLKSSYSGYELIYIDNASVEFMIDIQ